MLTSAPARVVWIALGFAGCAHGVELESGPTDFVGAGRAGVPAGSLVAGVGGAGGTIGGPAGSGGSAGSTGSGTAVTATGATSTTTGGGAGLGTGGGATATTSGAGGTGGSASAGAGGAGGSSGGAAGTGGALVDASADATGGGSGGTAGSSGAAGAGGNPVDAQAEPPPTCPTCTLKVQYRCFQNGNSVSQLELGLTVANASTAPIALNTITLRYWYRVDATGTQQATRVGSDLAVTLNVRQPNPPKSSADAYVEVGFVGAGMLAPGTDSGPIQISVRGSTVSNYDQTNDYSFQSTGASYVDATTVTAYTGTRLSWGTEPP